MVPSQDEDSSQQRSQQAHQLPAHLSGFSSKHLADTSLTVSGEDGGNFGHLNIEKILEKSKPSLFGKGDKTDMNLGYRKGLEVEERISLLVHISECLFVDKPVEIELYYSASWFC